MISSVNFRVLHSSLHLSAWFLSMFSHRQPPPSPLQTLQPGSTQRWPAARPGRTRAAHSPSLLPACSSEPNTAEKDGPARARALPSQEGPGQARARILCRNISSLSFLLPPPSPLSPGGSPSQFQFLSRSLFKSEPTVSLTRRGWHRRGATDPAGEPGPSSARRSAPSQGPGELEPMGR